MRTRFDVARPADYFTQLQSLPLLALPWWLEESFRASADSGFQADLIYATINFYYFTRILDDLMDGHAIQAAALPAMHPFHCRFIRPYFRYFDAQSAFWTHFDRLLAITVQTAAEETVLRHIGPEDFLRVSARKTAAAMIPAAAVCVRYGRMDLLGAWENMFALFGRWHQMRDDLLDWSDDAKSGAATWLLTEAERRRRQNEPLAAWMGREGLVWVRSVMRAWMDDTLAAASGLQSEKLTAYLRLRDEEFTGQIDKMIAVAEAFRGLARVGIGLR